MAWLGVDVGGTFTDLVLFDPKNSSLRILKTPSTPNNQAEGIFTGIGELDIEAAILDKLVHGTTVATNTALERSGPRMAVLATEGHKDVLVVGRGNRMAMYNIKAGPIPPLVPRSRCYEIVERIRVDGSVLKPLDEAQVEQIADQLVEDGITAVAICFLHSYANPDHERRCAEIIARRLPDAVIATSSEVLPEFREYERFSTTALNAYVAPRMRRYVGNLAGRLGEAGMSGPLTIMTSNGGSLPARRIEELPVLSMLSGPAAGVIAASYIGEAANFPNLITCDMGGTSTDVCLVRGGEYSMTTEGRVGVFPVKIRQIDINSVAVAGCSIAARSDAGVLSVGPHSAGSQPGPAGFGHGGTDATVTDANIVLGHLGTSQPLGGVVLHPEASLAVIKSLGEKVGLDPIAMAEGILRIAAVALAGAIKEISVMRGIDPRDFALLPFGGAGALHATDIADELGVKTVLVPPLPGNFSALGLLIADLRRDLVRTRVDQTAAITIADVRDLLNVLVADAEEEIAAAGYPADRRRYAASLDMRYSGQSFELSVPVSLDVTDMADIEAEFAKVYAARYGAPTAAPVEIVSYRVAAWGLTAKPNLPKPQVPRDAGVEKATLRIDPVYFGGKSYETPVFLRDLLPLDTAINGPVLIEEQGSTTVVSPDWTVERNQANCLVLRRISG